MSGYLNATVCCKILEFVSFSIQLYPFMIYLAKTTISLLTVNRIKYNLGSHILATALSEDILHNVTAK